MLEAVVQETPADRAVWAGDTALIHLQEAGQTGLTQDWVSTEQQYPAAAR